MTNTFLPARGQTYEGSLKTVGGTPMVALKHLSALLKPKAHVFAKIDYCGPTSSVKDRIAVAMLDDAREKGLVSEGCTVIEPTSGNTGVALAFACAARGYKFIAVMPDNLSVERTKMMRLMGAEVVLTPAEKSFVYTYEHAKELARTTPGAYMPDQFENTRNPGVYYETTAPEIWQDMDGKIDAFVCGIGTGGTIAGIGKFLKEKNPAIKVIGIEPAESPFLTTGVRGVHGIEGIGDSFEPPVLDRSVIDEIVLCKTLDARDMARFAASKGGLACGMSSGAALKIAFDMAAQDEWASKNIVTILPSAADRYMSTALFEGL